MAVSLLLFADASAERILSRDSVNVSYNAEIDLGKAYISGICFVEGSGNDYRGTIVNEFGVTLLSFLYSKSNDKLKLASVMKKMDKCYLKRMLRNDLKAIVKVLEDDIECVYENRKFKLIYKFAPQKFTDDSAK